MLKERLTPEDCIELQTLGLPTSFANGSFFKPDGKTFYYSATPYDSNTFEGCIPCWSLNKLFQYLKETYGDNKIICSSDEKSSYWTITIDSCSQVGFGNTVLEAVCDVIIKILKNVR